MSNRPLPGRRPVWASHVLGFRDPGTLLLWLPTSLMLVGLLTRGHTVLLPGIAGIVACGYFSGAGFERIAWMVAATVVAAGPHRPLTPGQF